jgi:ubiquinone/menaquinone biosynthesis C-methylase UbiE
MQSHSPFDAYASSYDAHFDNNPIAQQLRSIVQQTMLRYFQKGNSILELNCGTGTDAIFLAHHGMHVLATDSSSGMIHKTGEKIQKEHLEHLISTQQISFENLSLLTPQIFDGILSNFGGLNCTNNIQSTIQHVASLLRPQGYFILTVLNKFCLWETLSFVSKGKFSSAVRRMKRDGIDANIFGETVRTYYYFASDILSLSSNVFECKEIYGLNFMSPIPSATNFYIRHRQLSALLLRLEDERRHTYPLYNFSDHVVLVLQKK